MLGLDSALVYFIARQPEMGKQLTATAIILGVLSSGLFGAVAWFALPFLLSAQHPDVIAAARFFLLIGTAYAIVGIPHGSLRGDRSFGAWNAFRLAPGLAWLGILLVSYGIGHPNAIPLSRWYLAGVFVWSIPILVIVSHKLQGTFKPVPRLARPMLRFGLPSALTSLPQTINLRFDQLLIIAFLPARSLGWYVVAVSWSGAVSPLLSAVGSVLFPHVSAERDTIRQAHLLSTALQGGVLVGAAMSIVLAILAPVGLPLVFGHQFTPSVPAAVVLVPAGAILAWAGIAEEGLRGLGKPAVVLAAEIAAAVVTLAALPLLLHHYGILGAAVASLLGYSTIAAFTAVAISRLTGQPLHRLVLPSWPVAKYLLRRSLALLPGRGYSAARASAGRRELSDDLKVTVLSPYPFHMVEQGRQLHESGVLERMVTAVPSSRTGLPRELVASRMRWSALRRVTRRVIPSADPWLNRQVILDFDRWAATSLGTPSLVNGLSGFATGTLSAASARGMTVCCDRGSWHILEQQRVLDEEADRIGAPRARFDPFIMDRELCEYELADRILVPSERARQSFLRRGLLRIRS